MTRRKVLSTKKLDKALLRYAAAQGLEILEAEMIRVEPLRTEPSRLAINHVQRNVVIFTSKNAVAAVASLLDDKNVCSTWKIYAVGKGTAAAIRDLLHADVVNQPPGSGAGLAEQIARSEQAQSVVFFCGDKRRDELPEILNREGFAVSEIVVYETTSSPVKIDEPCDAVLFFSPSAVQSYFSANEPDADVVCFSIGNSTTEELRKFTNNKIITAPEALEESVVQVAVHALNILK